jgi:DNA-binding transcriptional regulator YhcF (GntR family)
MLSACGAQPKVCVDYLKYLSSSCCNTQLIPFRQISYFQVCGICSWKAVVSGQTRAGDPFPSVRELSKTLKINPNPAHKVVTHLVAEGVLEVHSGIGTVVAKGACSKKGSWLGRSGKSDTASAEASAGFRTSSPMLQKGMRRSHGNKITSPRSGL